MGYRDKALDNPLNWSFRIGRLFDIDIRVHIVFVLCAVILVAMEIPRSDSEFSLPMGQVLIHALGTYALLFVIVLLHEFGHCFGARYTGGEADEILLWPLGGLAFVKPPHRARAHMITTVAGPMVNLVLCLICAVVLVLWLGTIGAVPWNPIHPFWPASGSVHPTMAQVWVLRFFGLNYFLFLFNLLPIFPLDGGRVVQAWLWPKKGYYASMLIATGTGMVGAILLGLFALFLERQWLLLMIAVFGYITCWQTRRMLREQGVGAGSYEYDFSDGHTFMDREDEEGKRKPGFFARRRARKAALKAEFDRKREEERQRAVEQALRQVAESGVDSLTPRQRQILEEETRRQRAFQNNSQNTRP